MEQCNNCDNPFEGNFCSQCGQKRNEGRIILKHSAKDVLENYFDFDAPLIRTIKDLTVRPGKLIRSYVKGKRKSFSHPFKYYITVLALNIIISELIGFDPITVFNEAAEINETIDQENISIQAGNYLREHLNFFLLIFAFVLASFTKLLNRKSGFNFAEYLAMSFYIVGHYVLLSILPVTLSLVSPQFFYLNFVLVFIYPVWVLISFHEGGLFKRLLKGISVSLLAWIIYVATSTFIAILILTLFS